MLKACPPCLCAKAANAAKRQLGTVASGLGGAEPEPAALDPAMVDFQGQFTKNRAGTRHTHQHTTSPRSYGTYGTYGGARAQIKISSLQFLKTDVIILRSAGPA